jgi:hypothetical protein
MHNALKRAALVAVLALLICGAGTAAAGAATYYVDSGSAGSDSNAGTSAAAPWKTLTKVQATTLAAGDSVLFRRGGSWTGQLTVSASGTSSNPITFGAYGNGGDRPMLTYNCGMGFTITGDYVVVDGLLFEDQGPICYPLTSGGAYDYHAGGAVYLTSTAEHNIIRNNEMTNVGAGVRVRGPYNTITHNYIHDLHFIVPNAGVVGTYGAFGISLQASHTTVSYNRFERCRASRDNGDSGPEGYDGGSIEIEGFDLNSNDSIYDVDIHHNYSKDSEQFAEADAGTMGRIHIAYNFSDDYGVFFGFATAYNLIPDSGWEFNNNTVIKRHSSEQVPIFQVWGTKPATPWYHYWNNVFLINGTQQVSPWEDAPHDHNVMYRTDGASTASAVIGGSTTLGTGDVIADPRLLDASDGDGHLAASSPAIGAGTTTTYATDMDGSAVGASVDAGAFQRGAAGSDSPNMLLDPGFETQDDGSELQLGWTRDEGSGNWGVDNHVAGKSYSGSNNGWIAYSATTGTGWTDLAQQQIQVRPSTTYTFSCYTRDSGTIGTGYLGVYYTSSRTLGSKSETSFSPGTSYTLRSVTFTTGATTTWVTPYVGYNVASGTWMQIDACALRATDTSVSLTDGDFEGQTSSTIAAPWSRDQGTGTVSVDYHVAGAPFSGVNDARIATASGWTSLAQGPVAVQPDTFYRFTCQVKSSTNMPAGYLGMYWTTSKTSGAKNEISFPASASYAPRAALANTNAYTSLTPYVGYAGTVAGSWLAADACTLVRA